MNIVQSFDIDGPVLFEPRVFGDARGHFAETFRADDLAGVCGGLTFVQDNQSFSATRGTVRGLHLQRAPHAQGKLVRALTGSILDVAVDVRAGSPTYGRHIAVELSAENWRQLWIPPDFLHGFCTLTDDVTIAYKVTAYYSAAHDVSVAWDDAAIGIAWPAFARPDLLSQKDRNAIPLADLHAGRA